MSDTEAAIKAAAKEMRAKTDTWNCDLYECFRVAAECIDKRGGMAELENILYGFDEHKDFLEVLLACVVAAETLAKAGPGACRIVQERVRQIEGEGHTAEHDDGHEDFSLSKAAVCYARQAWLAGLHTWRFPAAPEDWPWAEKHWKPEPRTDGPTPKIGIKDVIRMLEKAGALIAAEIDRLKRAGG